MSSHIRFQQRRRDIYQFDQSKVSVSVCFYTALFRLCRQS